MLRSPVKLSRQLLFGFIFLLSFTGAATAKEFDDSQVLHIDYPDWFIKNPFLDLAEDLGKAKAKGKKGLMVLFTTEGCSYCDLFIKLSLGNPEIATRVQKDFDSVGLEIFDDNEMTSPGGSLMSVKHFAKKEGAGFSPTLLFYDHDGKRILRLVGYLSPERFKTVLDYMGNNHYLSVSFREYVKLQQVKVSPVQPRSAMKPDPLFSSPPYALDRSRFPASKPLMVIFEKLDCPECPVLHSDVLALKNIRNLLKKFEVVRLDAADSKTPVLAPDGQKLTPSQWYDQSGFTRVPALLFFSEQGKQVLETDTLVLGQRMKNSLNYVLEHAYKKGWTYQRFARSKAIERSLKKKK